MECCRLFREALRLPVGELLRRGRRKLRDEATKSIGRLLLTFQPRELSDRALVAVSSCATPEELVAKLRTETLLLPSPIACQQLTEVVERIRSAYPAYASDLIREADQICAHHL